jgi:hypothetical protein
MPKHPDPQRRLVSIKFALFPRRRRNTPAGRRWSARSTASGASQAAIKATAAGAVLGTDFCLARRRGEPSTTPPFPCAGSLHPRSRLEHRRRRPSRGAWRRAFSRPARRRHASMRLPASSRWRRCTSRTTSPASAPCAAAAGRAAGRLLRHRLPPQPARTRAALRPAARLTAEGIKRYGFHGLSYEYIAGVLPRHRSAARGRVVVAHLGNGASMCAMQNRAQRRHDAWASPPSTA